MKLQNYGSHVSFVWLQGRFLTRSATSFDLSEFTRALHCFFGCTWITTTCWKMIKQALCPEDVTACWHICHILEERGNPEKPMLLKPGSAGMARAAHACTWPSSADFPKNVGLQVPLREILDQSPDKIYFLELLRGWHTRTASGES